MIAVFLAGNLYLILGLFEANYMTGFNPRSRKILMISAAAVLTAIAIAYFCWPAPNAFARSRVRSIILSNASPREQVKLLEPYVKVGDNFFAVEQRLSPCPSSRAEVKRPTEWTLLLDGANLDVAVLPGGRVVGIGSEVFQRAGPRNNQSFEGNHGTIWMVGPFWKQEARADDTPH